MKTKPITILIIGLLFVLSLNFVSACYTPTGSDVGKIFNETSGSDLTICTGVYNYNSTSTHIFELQGSNYVFDCNSSNFYGNISGYNKGTMFRITGNDVTIKNCNIHSFDIGIEVLSSDHNHITDNTFYSMTDQDIYLNGASNNVIKNITSFGDLAKQSHNSIDFSQANNNNITNLSLYNETVGLIIYSSNNNNFENVLINESSTGFNLQDDGSNNNYFNKFTICNYPNSGISGNPVILSGNGYENVLNNSNIFGNNSRGIQISGKNKLIVNTNISGSEDSAISFAGSNSVNNTLHNLNISNNPGKGIYFAGSNSVNNTIYNNYFSNNSQHIDLRDVSNTPNYFNITKTLRTNIIGGANIGGNYYDNYTGTDADADGIGESNYSLGYGVFDYLPLTNNASVPTSTCYTPVEDDNIISSDTIVCSGNYFFNDSNANGIFLLNGSDYTFDCNNSIFDLKASGNPSWQFIYVNKGNNITIQNCNISNQKIGIKIKDSVSIKVLNSSSRFNVPSGLFQYGVGVDLYNVSLSILSNLILTSNNIGVRIASNSNSNNVSNITLNNITNEGLLLTNGANNNIVRNSNISGASNSGSYGVEFENTNNNNTFYNNYFSNNWKQVYANSNNSNNNYFNTTKTFGTNIIDGSYIGGNYYDDYTGVDTTGDGIGNSSYIINDTTNGYYLYYDYLPLTNNQSAPTPTVFNGSVNVSMSALNGFYEGNNIEFEINFSNFTSPTNASINFGDGNTSTFTNITSPYHVNHTYLDNNGLDNYTINVTVYDSTNSKTNLSGLEILNSVPFNLSWEYQTNQNSSFSFQPIFNDNGSLDTHTALIFWGDNTNLTININSSDLVYHNYSSDGNYTINFSITDNDNETSNFVSFNVSLHDDNFSISGSQTIYKDNLANITTFIDYLITQNISIDWGDSNITFDDNESNGTFYTHNYTSFGSFTINATLRGHRSGGAHAGPENYYYATLEINVIGCGDNIVQSGEECDGSNLNSKTCSNYGYNAGSLSCSSTCIIDSSDCHTQSSSGGSGGSVSTTPTPKKNKTIIAINDSSINKSTNNSFFNKTFNNTLKNITLDFNNLTVNNSELNVSLNLTNTTNNTLLKADVELLFSELLTKRNSNTTILKSSLQDLFSKLTFEEKIKNQLLKPLTNLFNKLIVKKNDDKHLRIKPLINTSCKEKWTCTDWTQCSNENTQTRTCFDENTCGSTKNIPDMKRSCAI